MPPTGPVASERIRRIQRRYQGGEVRLSVERARHFTGSWRETEGLSRGIRVGLAMGRVYERMTHYLDPDDRIAGAWTEFFQGMPIDVERGVFNRVLESEISRRTLLRHRGRSMARGLAYMTRKGSTREFLRNQRIARANGAAPLDASLRTMATREVNPFQIDRDDRRELLHELLPYWRDRCLVDRLEQELTGLLSEDMLRFTSAMGGNTSRQIALLSSCSSIATYQGHVILDFDRVLRVGLDGMRDEVQQRLVGAGEDRDFLTSVDLAIEGVAVFARRLAERVDQQLRCEPGPTRRDELREMLAHCQAVPFRPAQTFAEAVQALWTVKTGVELAHPVNLHCFGRLDQTLDPYYRQDLADGRITRSGARELLEELLLKNMTQNIRPESNSLGRFYHRYLGSSPVTVGGVRPDGSDATNEVTHLLLEAAHRSKAVCNVNVRVHPDTPDELLLSVARYLRAGTSVFALLNDTTNIEAMRRRGFDEEDARDYAIMGCVESTCPGKTGSMGANALQLCRLLDMALRNGDCRTMAGIMHGDGPQTGERLETFDQFLDAVLAQGRAAIQQIVDGSNLRDRLYAEQLPAPHISAFVDGCLDRGRDVTRGGGRYDLSGVSMVCSVANFVDSLHVIRELVFEQRRFTLGQLVRAIDHNFEGHDRIRREIDSLAGKWGNGDPRTDQLAHDVTQRLFAVTYDHRSFKDGPFVVYVISMITHTIDGRLSIATPDGRRAATPYAASCNPYNVERAGVTAVLRSVASLPFDDVMGCAVNLKFHPSAIGDRPGTMARWVDLVRTYFDLGGSQLQPTVASAEVLRRAKQDPDSHRDLIVKVGGYSTYFVDLGQEIQDEVIARTEHASGGAP